MKGLQLLACNGADDVRGTDHRPPQRVRAEHRLAEHVEYPILGIVLVHRDLLEHDLALGLQGFEPRLPDHLGEHVERPLQVTIQHARVQRGGFAVGPGVDLRPHRVEDLVDLVRAIVLGAAEQHVLQQMTRPLLPVGLDREPFLIQDPSATERTFSMRSVITRMPFESVVVRCSFISSARRRGRSATANDRVRIRAGDEPSHARSRRGPPPPSGHCVLDHHPRAEDGRLHRQRQ